MWELRRLMPISYMARIDRSRKVFWGAFGILAILEGLALWSAHHYFGDQMEPSSDPILKGAPQFIVLSLVVAFAVYLRQVNTNASELRDKINSGQVWNYPVESDHAEDKMQALDGVCEKLGIAAPFLILLTIVAAGRIVFDALLKFPLLAQRKLNWILFLVDLGIALWIFLLFVALAIVHRKGRKRDDGIRIAVRADEDKNRPTVQSMRERQVGSEGRVGKAPSTIRRAPQSASRLAALGWLILVAFFFSRSRTK